MRSVRTLSLAVLALAGLTGAAQAGVAIGLSFGVPVWPRPYYCGYGYYYRPYPVYVAAPPPLILPAPAPAVYVPAAPAPAANKRRDNIKVSCVLIEHTARDCVVTALLQ